jgi:hypothetical protein
MVLFESEIAFGSTAEVSGRGELSMKKIFLVMAIAFAFTTAMAVATVVAHTDQSSAWESAGRSAYS